jgi:hypothetical protein
MWAMEYASHGIPYSENIIAGQKRILFVIERGSVKSCPQMLSWEAIK